jgi:hypothetical protein
MLDMGEAHSLSLKVAWWLLLFLSLLVLVRVVAATPDHRLIGSKFIQCLTQTKFGSK